MATRLIKHSPYKVACRLNNLRITRYSQSSVRLLQGPVVPKRPPLSIHLTPSPSIGRLYSTTNPPSPPSNDPSKSGPSDVEALPFLPRPLGVPQRPSSLKPSRKEQLDELLDRQKHLEKRRHLIKEATKGYFEDFFKTTKGHGGKIWLAPKTMIREDKSLYFPNIAGKTLLGEKTSTTDLGGGHISVVALMSTQVSEEHTKSIASLTLDAFKDHPRFKFIQINLQENLLKSALVYAGRASLRQKIPHQFHHSYIHSSQNIEFLRHPIGAENKHVGFIYLVDQDLKIRWAACGYAKDEEAQALENCTRVLLERLDSQHEVPTVEEENVPP